MAGVVSSDRMLCGMGRIGRLLMVDSFSWVMAGMASSLDSSSLFMVGLAPFYDATTARGHATIKFISCGITLGYGAEFGIGVKIFFFTLDRAAISAIALVSNFVLFLLMVLQTVSGQPPL